jgi:hypothetical protein
MSLPQVKKSFGRKAPKYLYVAATSSTGTCYSDEDLQVLLDMFERNKIDVRVYTLSEELDFSAEPPTDHGWSNRVMREPEVKPGEISFVYTPTVEDDITAAAYEDATWD